MTSSTLCGIYLKISTRVQERIEYILKGCRCKTGCQTRRCKYQWHEPTMKCRPGCHCTNCTNTHTHHTTADNPEAREIELRERLDEHQPDEYLDDNDTKQDEMKEDKELEEIIHFVFGSDHAWDRTKTRNGLGNGSQNGSSKLKICSPSGRGKSFHGHALTSALVTSTSTQVSPGIISESR